MKTQTEKQIQARAKKRLAQQRRKERDPRFTRVMGRLVTAGLLKTTHEIDDNCYGETPVALADALWAGAVELRILELLPAILLKRPALIDVEGGLPDDLREVLHAIRHDRTAPDFRCVPADTYLQWIERVGRKGRSPSVLKSFRFQKEDVQRLRRLKEKLPARSETEVIRMALQALES